MFKKNCLLMQEMKFQSLGWEDPLEKEMATHSSILGWKIPWTKKAGGLYSIGWQQVWHGLATKQQQLIILCIEYMRFLTFLSLLDQLLASDTQELNRKLGILSRRLIEYTGITQISYMEAFINFLLLKICWLSKIIERYCLFFFLMKQVL